MPIKTDLKIVNGKLTVIDNVSKYVKKYGPFAILVGMRHYLFIEIEMCFQWEDETDARLRKEIQYNRDAVRRRHNQLAELLTGVPEDLVIEALQALEKC